jgi:hypothetical protein
MTNVSYKTIFLSFFLASGGTIGGWALTDKLAGDQAGYSFLYVGTSTVMGMIALQTIFYLLSKNRLLYHLLFGVALGFSIMWFLLCLFLPLFWVNAIGVYVKLLMFIGLFFLCVCNASKAFRQFRRKWKKSGEGAFAQHYKGNANSIDWGKVTRKMKLSTSLYIPGIPERATPIIPVLIILSMLLGLDLRNGFPIFSIFAWGIPASIIISIFVQMIGIGLAQALKIWEIEKRIGKTIRPTIKR